MNFLKKIFSHKEKRKSKAGANVSNHDKILFHKLGIDIQVVLLSEIIDNKEIAEVYSSLISVKYGVKTKVTLDFDKTSYRIWVYRIDLNQIDELYNKEANGWYFSRRDLIEAYNK